MTAAVGPRLQQISLTDCCEMLKYEKLQLTNFQPRQEAYRSLPARCWSAKKIALQALFQAKTPTGAFPFYSTLLITEKKRVKFDRKGDTCALVDGRVSPGRLTT
ncbi:hypothetical protein T11_14540 [Trichinella zimbabwensis]|uniref:Uncharacterized protein n=1 Tax=Trichinella zimbabwensis TaxID=268475 RepID=A0A0V1H6G7_9BILA|nr:hypothetical protein T11_14540 [Trichinella zimbabwensis]